jgi:hypothetical protein
MRLITAIILLVFFASPALATDNWTTTDKYMQVGVTVLTVIDWMQTRAIAMTRDDGYWEAINPILGNDPSTGRVDNYFACSVVVKGLISHFLPRKWRGRWQGWCLGISTAFIVHNERIGVRINKAF